MKILVVTQCFYPDVYMINDIVKILEERGHKVTVLTGLPDYTTSEIPEEYKHGKNRRQKYYGADVFRVSIIPRKHGPVWRSLNYISFALNGSLFALTNKWEDFDLIYVWQVSPVTMAIPAIVLKKKYKKPLFLYCMDIWPECVKAMGFKEHTFFYSMIQRISQFVYKRCDRIVVSSEPFFEYLENTNSVERTKMDYLPQYAPSDLAENNFTKKSNGHFDFLYIGNIGKAQNFDCLIQAVALLKYNDNITFHIVGDGSAFADMKKLAEETGAAQRMNFYGSKPFNEAVEFYKIADACVLTLDGSNHIGDTLPGKLQTYMAAGKPVIGAMNGAGKAVIEESRCGYCAEAGDYKAFAEKMLYFMKDDENTKFEYGKNARDYFLNHFTQEQHFKKLEQIMHEMAGK